MHGDACTQIMLSDLLACQRHVVWVTFNGIDVGVWAAMSQAGGCVSQRSTEFQYALWTAFVRGRSVPPEPSPGPERPTSPRGRGDTTTDIDCSILSSFLSAVRLRLLSFLFQQPLQTLKCFCSGDCIARLERLLQVADGWHVLCSRRKG